MQISDQLIEHLMIAARGIAWDKGVTVSEAEIARQHTRQVLEAALSAAEPVMYVSEGQLASCVGTYVPSRKTAEGLFQLALYRAPPAPSVAVKADAIVDRLFDDLRGRRFLKWIFDARGSDCYIGDMGGQKITGLDLDVQDEIKIQWSSIIDSALSAQVQDVAGWQLVPKEPTPEMLASGVATSSSLTTHSAKWAYRAMLAAAPAKQEG